MKRLAHPQSGFTLIEVLVSLALTGLLVNVVGQVAVQALQSERWADGGIKQSRKAEIVFEALQDDLEGRWTMPSGQPEITLSLSEPQALGLVTLAGDVGASSSLHLRRLPAQANYALKREGKSNTWSLVRHQRYLTDPMAKPLPEILATGLVSCEWEIYDGFAWQRSYPPLVRQPRIPLQLRVTLRWLDQPEPVQRRFALGELIWSESAAHE